MKTNKSENSRLVPKRPVLKNKTWDIAQYFRTSPDLPFNDTQLTSNIASKVRI